MSQKILLVCYQLEDGVPVDDTSEVLQSAYIPDELINWLNENNYTSEIEIKEEVGVPPDVSVISISSVFCMNYVLPHVENNLISLVQKTNEHISGEVLVKKELDDDFKNLLIWLNVRDVLTAKIEKYSESEHVLVMIG